MRYRVIACRFCRRKQDDGTWEPTRYVRELSFEGRCYQCGSFPERPQVVGVLSVTEQQACELKGKQFAFYARTFDQREATTRYWRAKLAE